MEKIIYVEGMTCNHCKIRVEKALNKLDGVNAQVELKEKKVKLTLTKLVDEKLLVKTIEDAGYLMK